MKTVTVALLLVTRVAMLLLAWVYMSMRLPMFSSYTIYSFKN